MSRLAVSLTTWLDAGECQFSLTTTGEAIPRPRPPGAAGWVAANHMGELLASAGKPVLPGDDLRSWRAGQERGDRRVRKK